MTVENTPPGRGGAAPKTVQEYIDETPMWADSTAVRYSPMTNMKFDVRFYLVAILFIIFDLEMSFLFPWAIASSDLGLFGYWSMMVFLGVLTIGFIYEWRKGALEWD